METLDPEDSLPRPFILELREEEPRTNGDFTPNAAVQIGPGLRASGLVRDLDAETLALLLLILSCVTANGDFIATPELLAPAAGVATPAMLERLLQLAGVSWRGKPLLTEGQTPTGMRLFRPSPELLSVRRSTTFVGSSTESAWSQGTAVQIRGVPRDQIIANNRALYGRPREQVEAEIAAFYGHDEPPQTPEEAERLRLKRRLTAHGLTPDQAELLLAQFNPNRIERQIDWLPKRHARNPAGYLVAAVEGNYGPPVGMLRRDPEPPDSSFVHAPPADTAMPDSSGVGQPKLDGLPATESGESPAPLSLQVPPPWESEADLPATASHDS